MISHDAPVDELETVEDELIIDVLMVPEDSVEILMVDEAEDEVVLAEELTDVDQLDRRDVWTVETVDEEFVSAESVLGKEPETEVLAEFKLLDATVEVELDTLVELDMLEVTDKLVESKDDSAD
jgi:hypothetical protein